MTTVTFRKIPSLIIAFVITLSGASFAAMPLNMSSIDIQELSSAQTFRYGRELYRKGDYAQAGAVF